MLSEDRDFTACSISLTIPAASTRGTSSSAAKFDIPPALFDAKMSAVELNPRRVNNDSVEGLSGKLESLKGKDAFCPFLVVEDMIEVCLDVEDVVSR